MKIKFIKEPSAAGYAYFTGDTADVIESVALELIADGYAVSAEDMPEHIETAKPVAKPAKKK